MGSEITSPNVFARLNVLDRNRALLSANEGTGWEAIQRLQ